MARTATARKARRRRRRRPTRSSCWTRRSHESGLAAGAQLRRAGIRLDFYTVRDLLFHLPRRYDDLREMRVDP